MLVLHQNRHISHSFAVLGLCVHLQVTSTLFVSLVGHCLGHYRLSSTMSDNDVFRMLSADDKLDGTNYPMWAYMIRHVLVSKGFWNVV